MNKQHALVAFAVIARLLWPADARAADMDELAKYLGFIEGFQHLFEFCQAEAKLSDREIKYSRDHIGERRALIFSGTNEQQRRTIMADAPAKKEQMLQGVTQYMEKEVPNTSMKEMCRQGFFSGVIESEQKADSKEVAAIRKAKQ
jgi:hypothetical protein